MPFKKTHKAISRNPLYCPHMALNISRGFPSFLVAQLDFSLSSFAPEKRSRGVTSHRKEKVALARGKVHKLPSREKKQTNKQMKTNNQNLSGLGREIDALHNLTHQQRNVLDKWLPFCQQWHCPSALCTRAPKLPLIYPEAKTRQDILYTRAKTAHQSLGHRHIWILIIPHFM